MILFSNPGLLDLRLITTFGASLKETTSPIGQFGTGLKYAIAGLLRLDQSIEMYIGSLHVTFEARPESIRNQSIHTVWMTPGDGAAQPCGFTTTLGQHWEPWMLYRELYANVVDEGGEVKWVKLYTDNFTPDNYTNIIVEGDLFEDVYSNQQDYFLSSTPLWTLPDVLSIHPASASLIALKGIRMANVIGSAENAAYTYNLLGRHDLTEDRTLKDEYHARADIARALLKCPHADIIKGVLHDQPGLEQLLDFDWSGTPPGPIFHDTAMALLRAKKYVPASVKSALKRVAPAEVESAEQEQPPSTLAEMIAQSPPAAVIPDHPYELQTYITGMERAIKAATKSAKYWEACAKYLAEQIPYDLMTDADEIANRGSENHAL